MSDAASEFDLLIEAAAVQGALAAGVSPAVVAARTTDPRLATIAGTFGTGRRDPKWTAAEDEFVRAHLGRLSEAEIGQALGRSAGAVHMRWSRELRLPAPSKDSRVLSANQVAAGLGLDSRCVRGWILRGWLPGRQLPGGDDTLVVERTAFLVWLTRPSNWPHFRPERVDRVPPKAYRGGALYAAAFWARARRLLDRARERWGDEWLTTRQAAGRLGVDVGDIKRWITLGRLPGVRLPDYDGRHTPTAGVAWAYWRVRRSDVDALTVKLGRGAGHEKPLTPRAARFAVLAHAVGLSAPAVAAMTGLPEKYVDHQLRAQRERGRLPALAAQHRLAVRFNAAGAALADWKEHRRTFWRLARACDRFKAGHDLDRRELEYVRGVLHAWAVFFARTPEQQRFARGLHGVGRRRTHHFRALYRQLRRWGVDPFRPLTQCNQESHMNITSATRTVTDYHLTLSEDDLATLRADPVEFAAELLAQLEPAPAPNGSLRHRSGDGADAAPKARKVHATKKTAGRKPAAPKAKSTRGRSLTASGLTKVACPTCGKRIAEKYLPLHREKKHSSTAQDTATAAA